MNRLVSSLCLLSNWIGQSNSYSFFVFIYILLGFSYLAAQTEKPKSEPSNAASTFSQDTARVNYLGNLSHSFWYTKPDTAFLLAEEGLRLAEKIDYKKGLIVCNKSLGVIEEAKENFDKSIQYHLVALKLSEETKDLYLTSLCLNNIGTVYSRLRRYDKALQYYEKTKAIATQIQNAEMRVVSETNIGDIHVLLGQYDKALSVSNQALALAQKYKVNNSIGINLFNIGWAYSKKGDYEKALPQILEALRFADRISGNQITVAYCYQELSFIYLKTGKIAESIVNGKKGLDKAIELQNKEIISSSHKLLGEVYEKMGDLKNAIYYKNKHIALASSQLSWDSQKALMMIEFQEKEADRSAFEQASKITKLELSRQQDQIDLQLYLMLAGTLIVVLLGITLFSYIRDNRIISKQKEEIVRTNEILEAKVKERTAKLIEQNKELTEYAFVNAHEIRGPLARMLGLVMLMKLEQSTPDMKRYVEMMGDSSAEMDQVIRRINKLLYDAEFIEPKDK
jgi:tetratricopeptide (TPR) repeat protein